MLKAAKILSLIGHLLNFVMLAIGVLVLAFGFPKWMQEMSYNLLIFFVAWMVIIVSIVAGTVVSGVGRLKSLNDPYSAAGAICYIVASGLAYNPALTVAGILQLIAIKQHNQSQE